MNFRLMTEGALVEIIFDREVSVTVEARKVVILPVDLKVEVEPKEEKIEEVKPEVEEEPQPEVEPKVEPKEN